MNNSIILPILLLCAVNVCAAPQILNINQLGGLTDQYTAIDVPDGDSLDMQNVRTDKYNSLSHRLGSVAYLSAKLDHGQPIISLYEYKQLDGDNYFIYQSSNSLYYSKGNGLSDIICSSFTANKPLEFTTASDVLYGFNGTDTGFRWTDDGAGPTWITAAISTNVPNCYIPIWHRSRMFYCKTTDAGGDSTIYYSEVNDPLRVLTNSYIPLNPADGDYITAAKAVGEYLMVTKSKSLWNIQEVAPAVFNWAPENTKRGSLYSTTLDEHDSFLTLLSDNGLNIYDGKMNLITMPINNQIKALNQLNIWLSVLNQTTAEDWGAGSGVNIDTTTYSGSVASTDTIGNSSPYQYIRIGHEPINAKQTMLRQSFFMTETPPRALDKVMVNIGYEGGSVPGGTFNVAITSANAAVILSSTIAASSLVNGGKDVIVPFSSSLTLTANVTYYITISTNTGFGGNFGWGHHHTGPSGPDPYVNGQVQLFDGTVWKAEPYETEYGWFYDCKFDTFLFASSSSYTTQELEATDWGSWGNFSVDETKPSSSTITYYVITATSSENLTTNTSVLQINKAPIPSIVGPYIQVITSMTRTTSVVVPMVHDITIQYKGASSLRPFLKEYDNCLYLFVSTNNPATTNEVAYVYQKNNKWTMYSGLDVYSSCLYNNSLYVGTSDGNIIRMEVEDVYQDSGVAYLSYYTTKLYNCNAPSIKKIFTEFIVEAEPSGTETASITASFRLHGLNDTWKDRTISLVGNNYIFKKLRFDMGNNTGKYIQFKYTLNGNHNIRMNKSSVIWDVLGIAQ